MNRIPQQIFTSFSESPKTAKQIKEIVFCIAGRAPDFFHLRFRKELLFHNYNVDRDGSISSGVESRFR
jgi:hypothetical protein